MTSTCWGGGGVAVRPPPTPGQRVQAVWVVAGTGASASGIMMATSAGARGRPAQRRDPSRTVAGQGRGYGRRRSKELQSFAQYEG